MDYKKIYNQIIEKAKSEERIKSSNLYYESHHIIPKCIGGDDSENNLVLLTAKEHFVCHKLLILIYPNQTKLVYALWMMSNGSNTYRRKHLKVSSRDYELSRKLYIETHSEKMKGRIVDEKIGKKISESKKGKPRPEHVKEILRTIGKGKVGEKNSFYGRKHTEESKKKMSESAKNKVVSEETKKKMSIIRTGKKHTEESKKKMSESAKNKIVSEETIIRLSNLRKGVKMSEEQKIKISESLKGKQKRKIICDICNNEIPSNYILRHKKSCIIKNNVGDSH